MVVKLYETNGSTFEDSVFADIAKYKKLDAWLMAVIKSETGSYPLDCSVNVNGKIYTLIHSGIINEDAEKSIKRIRRGIPARVNNFPNDYVEVTADWFERELYFKIEY